MLKLLHLKNPSQEQLRYFNELSDADIKAGQIYGLDPQLIVVVQYRESRLKKFAVSTDKKDVGGMQIRGDGAGAGYALTRKQLFDPWINTWLGTHYLRQQMNKCGGLTRGLAAYNRGHCTNRLGYGQRTVRLYKKILQEPSLLASRN